MNVLLRHFTAAVSRAKVLMALLAGATASIFTLAAVYNTFPGDMVVFGALRFEDESLQRFFAQFDLSPLLSVAAVLLLSVTCLVCRKWWAGIVSLFILPAQVITIAMPKALVDRPRPEGMLEGVTNSFPSGTAVTSILVLGLAIYFVGMFVGPRRLRITLQLFMGAVIVTFGVFRVLASEHWPSDLVGGYLVGGIALIGIVWMYKRLHGSWRRPSISAGRNGGLALQATNKAAWHTETEMQG